MKKQKLYITVLIAVCSIFLFNSYTEAQVVSKRWFNRRNFELFNQIGVGAGITTMGVTFEGITPINDNFFLRAGINYMPKTFSIKDDIRVNDPALMASVGYAPDYHVKFKFKSFTGHVLVDWYPDQFNPFHVVGGLYIGNSDFIAEGYLRNPTTGERSTLLDPNGTWPTLKLKGKRLNIDDGRLNAKIRAGEIVKPYIGVGYSKPFAKYKGDWSFACDAGILIQPTYEIRQDGKATSAPDYQSESLSINSYLNKVKVWPMVNFRIMYRAK
ncbi:hypothetical protein [Dysgonomonas sp. 25]|uniref:hypothetical protein n=1 Tax=Dysgonomonas sp. 25 TaxID=2302933 RepID=UPI0013CF6494|nr:hypothetical protein [Dysgonomonas sp. 25]NDV69557.1 hypothetical protein [Dysgonomonas sp. 25]